MVRRPAYSTIEEHPHLDDVLAALARVPHLTDDNLRDLAAGWRNTDVVAAARRRALSPDTPLVVDVLRAFDDITALYADDLAGEADYLDLEPAVVSVALKATRDAVAGFFARPVLPRGEFAALTAPWRALGRPGDPAGYLGPAAPQVQGVLDALAGLADRCHDLTLARTYDGLVARAMTRDEASRDEALQAAFTAAVLTGRRRVWALLRRNADSGLRHRCGACRPAYAMAGPAYDDERVSALCADAACALLVSDHLDGSRLEELLSPLSGLVPLPRRASEA